MAIVRTKGQKSIVEKKVGRLQSVQEVREFAEKNGVSLLPLDIKALVKLFNVQLFEEDMDGLSGYIEKRSDRWFIGINQYDHPRRQRFTIAHELAHFLLHKEIMETQGGRHEDTIMMRDGSANQIEKEANHYASELLMPENEIRRLVREGVNTIESLASRFDTSTAAMRYRLLKLGFLR